MEKEFNARCPNCGTEFVVEETGGKVMCPGCGEECSAVQAKKYYSTIHATKGEFKEAHGEEYHKEMMQKRVDFLKACWKVGEDNE